MLLLVLFGLFSFVIAQQTCASVLAQMEAKGHVPVPCLAVPNCTTSVVKIPNIQYSDGHATLPQGTSFSLCYTPDVIQVNLYFNNDIYLRNDYKNCNNPLYNQEVAEVFIAPGTDDTPVYHEIELSPNNILFVNQIYNPYLNGSITGVNVSCTQSGIVTNATKDPANQSWQGQISLPFTLISNVTYSNALNKPSSQIWRIGLYRIVMLKNTTSCDPSICNYGAWSPTFKNPPSFHQPIYFGVLVLDM